MLQDGYECWDLKRFTLDSFIDELKSKIPPFNENVLRNYKTEDDSKDVFGITEKKFTEKFLPFAP